MSVSRMHWEDLPEGARAAVQERVGAVLTACTASAGANSCIAASLRTADATVFVKGVPADHPLRLAQQREADIAPYLPAASPRLLWHVRAAGWDLLGYEHLQGRHAQYAPGSADLDLVGAAVRELQALPCPDVELRLAEQRWGDYADPGTAGQFAGDTLLHTDLAPHNILMTGRAHLVDWAWPTRGAAWIDPAVLILRLMEAGWQGEAADAWARGQFTSWASAPPTAVAGFAQANAALWSGIAQGSTQPWKKHMGHQARTWAAYCKDKTT